eukprot:6700143-Pyramimonas_sp.AAC.1
MSRSDEDRPLVPVGSFGCERLARASSISRWQGSSRMCGIVSQTGTRMNCPSIGQAKSSSRS